MRSADPPPNICLKVIRKDSRIASNVDLKRSFTSSFISLMVSRRRFFAAKTSSRWPERKSNRVLTSSYCSIASILTGPKALIAFSKSFKTCSDWARFSSSLAWLDASSKLILNSSVRANISLFSLSAKRSRLDSALACRRIHSSFWRRACSIWPATSSDWPSKSSNSNCLRITACSRAVFSWRVACSCFSRTETSICSCRSSPCSIAYWRAWISRSVEANSCCKRSASVWS